jgi:hypothetical protein
MDGSRLNDKAAPLRWADINPDNSRQLSNPAMQASIAGLTLRHDQKTTKLIDLTGKTQRLSFQHAHRGASVPLFYQFCNALVERRQLAKQSIELSLNRRPPSLAAGVHNCGQRLVFFRAHSQPS